VKEATTSLVALKIPQHLHKVVELGVSCTLEKNSADRDAMSKLLASLSAEGILKDEHF